LRRIFLGFKNFSRQTAGLLLDLALVSI